MLKGIIILLLFSSVSCAEPKWNEGLKVDGMDDMEVWGLSGRWIEEGKVTKLCFFYMKRYISCANIPENSKKK